MSFSHFSARLIITLCVVTLEIKQEIQRMFMYETGAHDPSHLIIFLTYRWRSHQTNKLSAIANLYLLSISKTIFEL